MSIQDLSQLLSVLRENGVTEYSCDGVSIKLGPVRQAEANIPLAEEHGEDTRENPLDRVLKRINPNYKELLLAQTDQ